MKRFAIHGVLLLAAASSVMTAQTKIASLGRCVLDAGGVIEDCKVAYRTFGTLSADRRNAVLLPTWFGGHVDDWLPLFGPNGMIDTSTYFAIAVQTLGSAPSSASSTSHLTLARGVSIRDMVDAEYRLAVDQLHLAGLHAVVGISLGGFQAFEWGARHPDFVRRIVSIGGTPRQSVYSRALWELMARGVDDGIAGRMTRDSALTDLARIMTLGLSTPQSVNRRNPASYANFLTGQVRDLKDVDLVEWSTLIHAVLAFDITHEYGGDIKAAAAAWKPKLLVVAATGDHFVGAAPAFEFARLTGMDTLALPNIGGHSAVFGDSTEKAVVRRWLGAGGRP